MNKTEKDEILSLIKNFGETAIDSLLGDGILKDVTFIGTGISVVKLINSASDRILLSKIICFIDDLNLKDQKEIDGFKIKYFQDSDYSKIGSKVLLILVKTTSWKNRRVIGARPDSVLRAHPNHPDCTYSGKAACCEGPLVHVPLLQV